MILVSNIATNIQEIRQKVDAAARRAGRAPEEVTIIAVTKNRTVSEIQAALAAGIRHLGENRVQEALPKFAELGKAATWHMIGTLQTNKARQALEFADLIHSVDRPSLVQTLHRLSQQMGRPVPVLVQVNVAGEESKHGLAPDDLPAFLEMVSGLGSLQVQGLMTIAPAADDPETVRPVFARLRELARRLAEQRWPHVEMRWLSMGMSGDYEAAIAEGANLVRIGTAIFGPRQYGAGPDRTTCRPDT